MLDIETFDARAGGNVIYKALAHPLAAEAIGALYCATGRPGRAGRPRRYSGGRCSRSIRSARFDARYVQDVAALELVRAGLRRAPADAS